jgi:hypothetical protein
MSLYAIEGHDRNCSTGLVCRGTRPALKLPFRIAVDLDCTIDEQFVVVYVANVDAQRFCFETTTPAAHLPTSGMAAIIGRHLATIYRVIRCLGTQRQELVVVDVYRMPVKPFAKVVDVTVGVGYVLPARVDGYGCVCRDAIPVVEHVSETVQSIHVGLLPSVLTRIARLSVSEVAEVALAARRAR